MAELFLDGRAEGGWLVRCHHGSLKVGDRLSRATDPAGEQHAVDLTCVEIRRYQDVIVGELESNHGRLVVFAGPGMEVMTAAWVLSTS